MMGLVTRPMGHNSGNKQVMRLAAELVLNGVVTGLTPFAGIFLRPKSISSFRVFPPITAIGAIPRNVPTSGPIIVECCVPELKGLPELHRLARLLAREGVGVGCPR